MKEKKELLYSYQLIHKEMNDINRILAYLEKRDEEIYRVIFEAPPIVPEMRRAGAGGSQKLKYLLDKKISKSDVIFSISKKIDQMKRKMSVQAQSYDQLARLAKDKTALLKAIPAIQPISNKELTRLSSGFGMRVHPILKVRRKHTGIDFSAPKGTPIYTTADGKVRDISYHKGYGKRIEIIHGFEYVTRYAHLSKWNVKEGQKVKRGQKIGEVGNTGLSLAPHLHYEIIHSGRKINPINYFFYDISPEEYEKLLILSSRENQSLGY